MSAKRSSFGMRHVTVVPTNFTPQDGDEARDDAHARDDDVDSRDEGGARASNATSDAS